MDFWLRQEGPAFLAYGHGANSLLGNNDPLLVGGVLAQHRPTVLAAGARGHLPRWFCDYWSRSLRGVMGV